MNPETDIVIAVRGVREFPNEADLVSCVETICQNTKNFRLVFVDDGSDNVGRDVVTGLASRFSESVLVRTHKQHWFTRAFNLGLNMVRTPWAVMLNADTLPEPGWLEELYGVKAELEGNGAKVGIVGSVYSPNDPRRCVGTTAPDYVTGHCVLINMEAAYEAAANRGTPRLILDETSPLMIHIRSDVEICHRMNRLGYYTAKAHKSAVQHIGYRAWGARLWSIPNTLDAVRYRY